MTVEGRRAPVCRCMSVCLMKTAYRGSSRLQRTRCHAMGDAVCWRDQTRSQPREQPPLPFSCYHFNFYSNGYKYSTLRCTVCWEWGEENLVKDDDWIDGRFCVCGCFYSFSELAPKTSLFGQQNLFSLWRARNISLKLKWTIFSTTFISRKTFLAFLSLKSGVEGVNFSKQRQSSESFPNYCAQKVRSKDKIAAKHYSPPIHLLLRTRRFSGKHGYKYGSSKQSLSRLWTWQQVADTIPTK